MCTQVSIRRLSLDSAPPAASRSLRASQAADFGGTGSAAVGAPGAPSADRNITMPDPQRAADGASSPLDTPAVQSTQSSALSSSGATSALPSSGGRSQSRGGTPSGAGAQSGAGVPSPVPPPGDATAARPRSGRSEQGGSNDAHIVSGDRIVRSVHGVLSGQSAADYAAKLLGWADNPGLAGGSRGAGDWAPLGGATAGPSAGVGVRGLSGGQATASGPRRAAARAPSTAESRRRMRDKLEHDFTCPVTQVQSTLAIWQARNVLFKSNVDRPVQNSHAMKSLP